MRILIVRHGQTEWNRLDRAQGHSDVSLDARGRRQAELVVSVLAGEGIEWIVSSDLSRAVETARPLAEHLGLDVNPDPALRERCFGELEGRSYGEVRAWFQAQAPTTTEALFDVAPPGGESERDLWHRLGTAQAAIEAMGGTVAVFTHGGAGSMLLARLICGTVETARSFRLGNGSVTELSRRPDGRFHLARFNDTTHLMGLDAEDPCMAS